ncbi:SHOCT domain-containing protein [Halococcus thailandensis]|uniref:SHOCT domain-containing protein n=1 Tax=Halococcus thailandensis JCM 13552 TaxID=1227457 RepID=M0N7S0_9EURY|nr:SHOCT domain-containing protein [Halococcus thailandensis]EMA53598.1 hypothetical protein C451_09435 [Halococcus thailandensis JCM 13552]
MSDVRERAAENASEIASMIVLGLGFLALFTGFTAIPFWLIWVIGFTVIVPLVEILAGEEGTGNDWTGDWADWFDWSGRREHRHGDQSERQAGGGDGTTTDALETLRERYARGDLTDEQFERKLDTLLETDSPENAADWRYRERERIEEES